MGTALLLQHHQSLLVSSFSYITSPITTADLNNHRNRNYIQLLLQNVLQQQPMRYLTLKRITTATTDQFRFKFYQPKYFCAINNNNSCLKGTMADTYESVRGNSTILNGEKEEEKQLEKSTPRYNPPPPPPPEKPLPDDCCGSGCVRCVWDIYYEELEAYNKLYKTGPDSSGSSNSSGASSKLS